MKEKIGAYRWRILALLFFATSINYIDRQVIGLLKPYISEELGWSEMDYSRIVMAFQVAYAVGVLFSGRLLDRFGTRMGYFWAVIIWSIAGVLHATARSVTSFAAVRFLLGLGEAANFPAAVKTTAEWFPKRERAFATGLFNAGSTVGAIIAPIIVALITISWGWKATFVVTGVLGLVWAVFWLVGYEIPSKHKRLSNAEHEYICQDVEETQSLEEGDSATKEKWYTLLKRPEVAAICTTRLISDWVWWFFLFWIPDFMNKVYEVDIKASMLPIVVIYAVSSFGGVGGGWLSSYFIKLGRSVDYARKTTILICALMVLPVMCVSFIDSLWISVGLIALAAAGHQAWASNIFTLVSDLFPKNRVATITGLAGFFASIGGIVSASCIGWLLDTTGSYFLIFLIASSVYLINWIIIKFFVQVKN